MYIYNRFSERIIRLNTEFAERNGTEATEETLHLVRIVFLGFFNGRRIRLE